MLDNIVGDRTMKALEMGLDVASARHRAVSGNVANANTPGYKRKDISFEAAMRAAEEGVIQVGREGGFQIGRMVQIDSNRSQRNDGNNVDIDFEMTVLAENAIVYNALARQLSQKISLMRAVITEGRR